MGLAVTERLVKLGWNVAIVDFNEKFGQSVAQRLGEQVYFVKANVAIWDQLRESFVKTWEKWGRLDFGEYESRERTIGCTDALQCTEMLASETALTGLRQQRSFQTARRSSQTR
jgi:NAD(P)-dependent dehydrogenase (short-subunit alcohol dehydrogenase family)